jgi:creatinine amidohydrolase
MKYKYEEMLPDEFIEAVDNLPVFIVPTGLLEWHGDHLPLGLDSLKAHGICCEIAEKLGGGIVLPPNYIGRPGFSSYVGTLTYSEALVNALFYEMFGQLVKVGAKVIVLLTGHYGPLQVDCIKRVAHCFEQENPSVKVLAFPEYEDVIVDGLIPADHAALWETSMFWYLYPDQFNMDKLKLEPNKMKLYLNPLNDYYKESEEWSWSNDVMKASPELGKKAIEEIVNVVCRKINIALKQE